MFGFLVEPWFILVKEALVLRELEKAAAAFAPVDEAALVQWPVIATGNWGCGAFETGKHCGDGKMKEQVQTKQG